MFTTFALALALASADEEEIDRIFSRYDQEGEPGCALAVIEAGEVIYAKGYGEAQVEFGAPITPDTPFHVASVSKQFTALAVILLEQEGYLSLDDEVRDHVFAMPDFGKKITIRHLLHHTSGLRDQWDLLQLAGWRKDDVITHEDVMSLVARQTALNFDPGARHMYCNTGYTLLDEVVRAASGGKTLRQYAEEKIFEPLGMEDTHFHDDHTEVVPGRAYSYRDSGRGISKAVLSYSVVGATSLFTTANDLRAWVENIELCDVGGDEGVEALLTRGVLNSGRVLDYAAGISHGLYRDLPTLSHSGGDAGFRCFLVMFPEQEFSIAVLGNVSSLNPEELAFRVADYYLSAELGEQPRPNRQRGRSLAGLARRASGADAEDPFSGYFTDEFHDRVYQVISREGVRSLEVEGRSFELKGVEGEDRDLFAVDARSIESLRYQRDDAEEIVGATLARHGVEPDRLTKVTPAFSFRPDEYGGRYFSDELDVHYDLVAGRGELVLHRRHYPSQKLEVRYRDGFSAGGANIHFVREDGESVSGFLLSTESVKNLAFRRLKQGEASGG